MTSFALLTMFFSGVVVTTGVELCVILAWQLRMRRGLPSTRDRSFGPYREGPTS